MSAAALAPAGVGYRAGSVGSILWEDIERALAGAHPRAIERLRMASMALQGAELMTEPGTADRAWLQYLGDSALALLHDRMGLTDR